MHKTAIACACKACGIRLRDKTCIVIGTHDEGGGRDVGCNRGRGGQHIVAGLCTRQGDAPKAHIDSGGYIFAVVGGCRNAVDADCVTGIGLAVCAATRAHRFSGQQTGEPQGRRHISAVIHLGGKGRQARDGQCFGCDAGCGDRTAQLVVACVYTTECGACDRDGFTVARVLVAECADRGHLYIVCPQYAVHAGERHGGICGGVVHLVGGG